MLRRKKLGCDKITTGMYADVTAFSSSTSRPSRTNLNKQLPVVSTDNTYAANPHLICRVAGSCALQYEAQVDPSFVDLVGAREQLSSGSALYLIQTVNVRGRWIGPCNQRYVIQAGRLPIESRLFCS